MGKLKIKGYDKLFKEDIGEWRVGKIVEEEYAYHIILMNSVGGRKGLILERDKREIDFDGYYYQLRDTFGEYINVHMQHLQKMSDFKEIVRNFLNR